jgi:hypothetical protein
MVDVVASITTLSAPYDFCYRRGYRVGLRLFLRMGYKTSQMRNHLPQYRYISSSL